LVHSGHKYEFKFNFFKGTGCNRAFLSSHDFCWSVYNFFSQDPIELLSERETAFRLCFASEDSSIKQPFSNIGQDPKSLYKHFSIVKKCESEQYDKELFSGKSIIEVEIPEVVETIEVLQPKKTNKERLKEMKNSLKQNIKLEAPSSNLAEILKSPSVSKSPMNVESFEVSFEDELEQIFKKKQHISQMIDKLKHNVEDFTKLEIGGEEIVDTIIKVICSNLKKNYTLESLIIHDSNITNASLDYLSKLIESSKTLRNFSITKNSNTLDISPLIKSLEINQSIHSFVFDQMTEEQKESVMIYTKRNSEIKSPWVKIIEKKIVSSPIDPSDFSVSPRCTNVKDIQHYSDVVVEFTHDMPNYGNQNLSSIIESIKMNDEHLIIVDLNDRGIEDKDLTELLNSLEKNTTVKVLNLMENSIRGECIDDIVSLILKNKTLEQIHFAGNNIPSAIVGKMVIAIKKNSTLIQFTGGKKESEFQSKVIEKHLDRNYKLSQK
jgi:hypothetical protein